MHLWKLISSTRWYTNIEVNQVKVGCHVVSEKTRLSMMGDQRADERLSARQERLPLTPFVDSFHVQYGVRTAAN